ncbi:unnamed protein product, partial [Ectocarpus sp. 12 AP-2014]
FNVGTHTAKRASARARKIKRANRSSCASCAVTVGAPEAAEVRGEPLSAAASNGHRHLVATFSRRQQNQKNRGPSSNGGKKKVG